MVAKKINYKYWASLDKWTQKEIALLMVGMDPDSHKEVRLNSRDLPAEYAEAADISRAHGRIDWVGRYGSQGYQISGNPMYAVNALISAGWDAPDELLAALRERAEKDRLFSQHGENNDNDNEESAAVRTNSASTRERKTMLKLILGLACGGYGMDPSAEKNRHAKSMREDLEKLGIPLDDATIKKYLDEARQLRRVLMAIRPGQRD